MLKKFSLALILAFSSMFPVQAQSMDWLNIANSRNGDSVDVDLNSIQSSGSLVSYRLRVVYSRPTQDGAKLVGYQQITDCNSGVFQVQEIIAFNRQRNVILNQRYDNAPVRRVEQGTLGHATYNFVCQAQNESTSDALLRARIQMQRDLLRAYTVDIPNSVSNQLNAIYQLSIMK
ncbi:MAG: hypothetical protein KME59_27040 [Trichormus sp. ATA11-4-KO1]|jgi:hypothetical protein|nr:hypothetical protein [Trichormus sp. ATA11-4-KO1]